MERLEDLQGMKNLEIVSSHFPSWFQPQDQINWLIKPLPYFGGKTPIDLAFEGQVDVVRAQINILKKPFRLRVWDYFIGSTEAN